MYVVSYIFNKCTEGSVIWHSAPVIIYDSPVTWRMPGFDYQLFSRACYC